MTVVIDIVELINTAMKSLRESEQQVAAVVLEDQQFAVSASTTELARRANVSATSITRFCRALGFQGLREFKLCVAQNLAVNAHFMANSTTRTDSFSELVEALTNGLAGALSDMNKDISLDVFSDALDIIASARHINVFPLDQKSQGMALDAHVRLLRLGLESSIHVSAEEQRIVVGAAREQSAFLMIGADTAGLELSDLFEIIGVNGADAILIGPGLVGSLRFPGAHLIIRSTTPVGVFSLSALRYKQAILIDLICTGHSLNLSENLAERKRRLEMQLPPPLKK
jgi:RpiR family transcriptional regulator, carbohydrate utilization regulator